MSKGGFRQIKSCRIRDFKEKSLEKIIDDCDYVLIDPASVISNRDLENVYDYLCGRELTPTIILTG